jgi:hydrogenase-4 component F
MELLIVITSLIFAALVAIFVKKRAVIEAISIVASAIIVVESVIIALKVAATGSYEQYSFFSIDSLGSIVMLVIACVDIAAVVYSVQYLRKETDKNIIGFNRVKQYFILLNLFSAAMFFAISASSPIFAWIAIEATTLSTAFLISFYNKPSAIQGAWKYLIINSVGLLLGFFGTLVYFTSVSLLGETGLITWQDLLHNASSMNPLIAKIAFVFALIGYGTKVGFVPMHTWKPSAYGKSPAPIGALFSGALLPVAFYIILKFKAITDSVVGPEFSSQLLILFGVLSVAVPAFIILIQRDYKRLLAYSSIENAGMLALGFGFGGIGVMAALLHLIYHSLVKSALFFLSGNFLLKYHSAKIANIKYALKVLPVTSVLFIIGVFACIGMPPFGIFFTKVVIFSAGIKTWPLVTVMTLIFVSIVFIGFLKHVSSMVFGEKPTDISKGEDSVWLIISPLVLIILALILSFYLPPFLHILIDNSVLHY